jgi:hypothetical protein
LVLCFNSEGIKEKHDEYSRLQVEDPVKAKAMLAEFMSIRSNTGFTLTKPSSSADDYLAKLYDAYNLEPLRANLAILYLLVKKALTLPVCFLLTGIRPQNTRN